jgi:hypothetical protein
MDNGLMVKARGKIGEWLEHWARIRRGQNKLIRMCDGLQNGLTREDAIDDVLAFFLFCYHFRDALIRDGHSQETEIDATSHRPMPWLSVETWLSGPSESRRPRCLRWVLRASTTASRCLGNSGWLKPMQDRGTYLIWRWSA